MSLHKPLVLHVELFFGVSCCALSISSYYSVKKSFFRTSVIINWSWENV